MTDSAGSPFGVRRIVSKNGRAFPLQLDGDYIGDVTDVELGVRPLALAVVS